MIIFYSTDCPKCKILKKILMTNNITFNENNNIDEMVSLGIEQVPIIKLEDNTLLDYNEALKWISSYTEVE